LKKALKTFRKSVEDSLRTANSRNKNEDLDARKRRCNEFVLGETLSTIVPVVSKFFYLKDWKKSIWQIEKLFEEILSILSRLKMRMGISGIHDAVTQQDNSESLW